MALATPYCTQAEADTYLDDSITWGEATSSQKDDALFWGRMYIDSNYKCVEIDMDDIYDEVKYANALLAEAYLDDTLFTISETGDRVLTSIRVKAGDVESEKRYQGDRGFTIGNRIDRFPNITAILSAYCTKKGKTNIITRV